MKYSKTYSDPHILAISLQQRRVADGISVSVGVKIDLVEQCWKEAS